MAQPTLEGLTLNSGSGGSDLAVETLAGGDLVQVVMPAYSTGAGTINVVTTGEPLPVEVYDVAGTLVADAGSIKTAVEVIDNAVFVDDAAYTLGSSSGIMMMGFAGTQSVNANDAAALACTTGGALYIQEAAAMDVSAATVTVDNGGTFAVQVDGNALTALQLIDDAVHADDAAFTLGTSKGVMAMGFAGTQSVNANDAAALACTTGGALYIQEASALDVSAATVTVTGTVTANLGATDNAVLDSIDSDTTAILADTAAMDTNIATLAGAVAGTEMQVDLVSANVTNAGTFAVQVDGAALTALQLIDDAVYVDDADWTDTTSKHLLVGGLYQSVPQTITDGDVGPFQVDSNGNIIESNSTAILADTANLDTNVAAVLADTAAMDTNLATLAGAVAGTEMQVDLVSANVTNAGTFAVQVDGDALTALQVIDNAVHVDDAAFTLGTSSGVMMMGFAGTQSVNANDAAALACTTAGALYIQEASALDVSAATVTVDLGANNDVTIDNSSIVKAEDAVHSGGDAGVMPLAVRNDDLAALAGADGDYAPLQVDANGALFVNACTSEYKNASGVAASGTVAMVSAVASRKITVHALALIATSATANTVYVANDDNALLGNSGNPIPIAMDADGDNTGGLILPFNPGGWFTTDTVNEAVNLILSAAQDIVYAITYTEVP